MPSIIWLEAAGKGDCRPQGGSSGCPDDDLSLLTLPFCMGLQLLPHCCPHLDSRRSHRGGVTVGTGSNSENLSSPTALSPSSWPSSPARCRRSRIVPRRTESPSRGRRPRRTRHSGGRVPNVDDCWGWWRCLLP